MLSGGVVGNPGSVEIQWEPVATPVSDCHPSTEFPSRKKGFPSVSVFQWQDGPPQTGTGLLKTGGETACMEHFSVPAIVFCGKNRIAFRKETDRLPQRRNFFAARQFLRVQKGGRNKASEGFFPLWMESARMQILFVLLQAILITRLTRGGGGQPHGVPWRAAKCRGNRLPAFILHSLGRARFAHFRPVAARARLRDSCRGCLDVLTGCHWGLIALRRPFGTFATRGGLRHRNRQGSFRGPSFFPSRNC